MRLFIGQSLGRSKQARLRLGYWTFPWAQQASAPTVWFVEMFGRSKRVPLRLHKRAE